MPAPGTPARRRFLVEATYGATRRFLMSQCAQAGGTNWTIEAPTRQFHLDGGLVSPYDEHSGASASSGRVLSRSVERFGEGALTRSGRAHAALYAPSSANPAPAQSRPHRSRRRHHAHQTVLTFGGGKRPNDDQSAWRSTYESSEYVFTKETGGHYHPHCLSRLLGAYSEELGLPRLTAHGLRHTSAHSVTLYVVRRT
jgi:hypothetical protein